MGSLVLKVLFLVLLVQGEPVQQAYRVTGDERRAGESLGELFLRMLFPMDLGIPPLKIKNLLESNPLKVRLLVCGLTAMSFTHSSFGCAVLCSVPNGMYDRSGLMC